MAMQIHNELYTSYPLKSANDNKLFKEL